MYINNSINIIIMDEHIIEAHEDYGQFIEIDIESLEVVYKPSVRTGQSINEYKPSIIYYIYVLFMCFLKKNYA